MICRPHCSLSTSNWESWPCWELLYGSTFCREEPDPVEMAEMAALGCFVVFFLTPLCVSLALFVESISLVKAACFNYLFNLQSILPTSELRLDHNTSVLCHTCLWLLTLFNKIVYFNLAGSWSLTVHWVPSLVDWRCLERWRERGKYSGPCHFEHSDQNRLKGGRGGKLPLCL